MKAVTKEILRFIAKNCCFTIWGHSSAGRAPAWHAGGQEFESPWLHFIFRYTKSFQTAFSNNITFSTYLSKIV